MRRLLSRDKQQRLGRKAQDPTTARTLLDSGLLGAGGGGRGRPGHRLLALGLPSSSGLGGLGPGSRHGSPDRRGPRRLVFLVLAAHIAAAAEYSSRSRSRNHPSTASKNSLRSPGTAQPPCLLYPGFWGLSDRWPRNWSSSPRSRLLAASQVPAVCRAPSLRCLFSHRVAHPLQRKKESRKYSRRQCDSTTFVSHGPLLRLHFASLSARSRSIVGRREIRSHSSGRWRTRSGMSSSACSRTTRLLRPELKKTRKRRRGNGRGRQGLRKRPGKEAVQVVFFSAVLREENTTLEEHEKVGCTMSGVGK